MRGVTVFRALLPPSLISDLRRVMEHGRELVRARHGPQSQRLQPISAYEVDTTPFENYRDLPELRNAIDTLLGPEYSYGDLNYLGVLMEPAQDAYCTAWHRDVRDNMKGMRDEDWQEAFYDIEILNQVNCPLYDDSCTWIVPGSHLRDDLPRERELFPTRPVREPELDGKSPAERERICLEYCQSMPGGEQLHLHAGDFALYRATSWHIGNYVPYRKRATLHDGVETVKGAAWREKAFAAAAERRKAGHEFLLAHQNGAADERGELGSSRMIGVARMRAG